MDTLQSMKVFVRVAKHAGFAAAARELRISPAAVTKHVAALERRLGARLFDRTTRRVALTEPGRIYLERCLECLQALDDADGSVRSFTSGPRGLLRITAPEDLPHDLPALIAKFMEAFPEVMIQLKLSNRPIDLVDEGVDLALRVASPTLAGDYIARPLCPLRVGLVASPGYLRGHGRPRTPRELSKHRNLVFSEPSPRLNWSFERAGKRVDVVLEPALLTNSGNALLAAAAAGAGLSIAPSFSLRPFLASGQLELLLPDWRIAPELRLFAIYPHRRFVSPNVAFFVEALRQAFGDGKRDPYWPAP